MEHRLKAEGHFVVSLSRSYPKYRKPVADEYNICDLSDPADLLHHLRRYGYDHGYQFSSETGGISYIADAANDAAVLTNSVKINLNILEAIRQTHAVGKIFFASSQCVYPEPGIDPFVQERIEPNLCREKDARFENNFAFAKEKLYAEALYDAYNRNHGIEVRVGRLGNVYGPYCAWNGSRAKAVASICRKVSQAGYAGLVKLWGDGQQVRSFTYVDDAIEGILRLMASDYSQPVNIASSETVTIAQLFEQTCRAAGKILAWEPEPGPTGVRHRASDNTLCRKVLNWEPEISLAEGLAKTYPWVAEQALTKGTV